MLTAICHADGRGWSPVADINRLSDIRAEGAGLLWAESDVDDLSDAERDTIAAEFDLHPLAVEDALHARQRPKLERYEEHLFLVLHQLDEEDEQLEPSQIACFVGDSFLLAIHAGGARTLDEAKRRLATIGPDEAAMGSAQLVHTLLDVIVDDYQAIADDLEQEIETLEEIVLTTPGAPVQRQLYSLKQRLARLRRYALPASRVLDWIMGGAPGWKFADASIAHFRDVHDHLLRITDQIRNVDELSQAVLDLTRAEQANALNQVTKRLTGWAAIIAVPTYIASVYGMNFELVPRSGHVSGFFFALALMVVSGVGLYVYFKRRDWI